MKMGDFSIETPWDTDEEVLERDCSAVRHVKAKTGLEILNHCRTAVKNKSAVVVNGTMVCMQTANCIVTLHDSVNDANKAKFLGTNNVVTMGMIAQKLLMS